MKNERNKILILDGKSVEPINMEPYVVKKTDIEDFFNDDYVNVSFCEIMKNINILESKNDKRCLVVGRYDYEYDYYDLLSDAEIIRFLNFISTPVDGSLYFDR